jgi:hypothetical protein
VPVRDRGTRRRPMRLGTPDHSGPRAALSPVAPFGVAVCRRSTRVPADVPCRLPLDGAHGAHGARRSPLHDHRRQAAALAATYARARELAALPGPFQQQAQRPSTSPTAHLGYWLGPLAARLRGARAQAHQLIAHSPSSFWSSHPRRSPCRRSAASLVDAHESSASLAPVTLSIQGRPTAVSRAISRLEIPALRARGRSFAIASCSRRSESCAARNRSPCSRS